MGKLLAASEAHRLLEPTFMLTVAVVDQKVTPEMLEEDQVAAVVDRAQQAPAPPQKMEDYQVLLRGAVRLTATMLFTT